MAKKPEFERRIKLKRLRTGMLDTAVQFASFLDIRPRFTDDRSAIEEFVPVILFQISTESETGEDKSHVFQLTTEGVAKLKVIVDDVERKLATLKKDRAVIGRLNQHSTREEEDS